MVQGYWCCACATHFLEVRRTLRWNHISHSTCRDCQHSPCLLCFFDDVAPRSEDPIERAGADLGLREWIVRMRDNGGGEIGDMGGEGEMDMGIDMGMESGMVG